MRRSIADQPRFDELGGLYPILLACWFSGGFILQLPLPSEAKAQTWNGSVSDLWGTAANWTPNTVPNSSGASVTITSNTNNPVLININPTIANLTLGGAESLTLDNSQSLTIAGW